MKRMLRLYGQDIFSVDSTGSTNKYNLDLFALVVLDNQRHVQCGGIIILQNADAKSIQSMLKQLRDNNKQWKPKHMMTDKDSAQMLALGT